MVRPNVEDPATERIFLRLTSGDKELLRQLAAETDETVSAYLLRRGLKGRVEAAVPSTEKGKAQAALSRALRRGLVRPGPCAHAHKGACKGHIGGHHASHRIERWLDVTWLCDLHLAAEVLRLGKKPKGRS